MNLTNVESYTQKVVLGLVILGAVLLDRVKQQGWLAKAVHGRAARDRARRTFVIGAYARSVSRRNGILGA